MEYISMTFKVKFLVFTIFVEQKIFCLPEITLKTYKYQEKTVVILPFPPQLTLTFLKFFR